MLQTFRSVSTCPGGGVDTLSQILKQAVLGTDPLLTCFGVVSTCCLGSENSCSGNRIQCQPALVLRRPGVPNSENCCSRNKLWCRPALRVRRPDVSTCPGGGVDTLSQILKQAVLGTDLVSTCFGVVSTCCPGSENSCSGNRIQCQPALVLRQPAIPNSENYCSGNKLWCRPALRVRRPE
ncbi:hypothetical protein Taro_014549 [Colocasia esculenta]|uniref:Uncharacterized protein n=1 Tax=Colocasia esculenta TaxID=4460 RepID=A0A843UF72_COLES|nr:hypothetical protein [Colocasia esculenta]